MAPRSTADDRGVDSLNKTLPQFMGPAFEDVEQHLGEGRLPSVDIDFDEPSPFLLEALEIPIRQSDNPEVGTGPFQTSDSTSSEPSFGPTITTTWAAHNSIESSSRTYPSIRAAWADLLRDQVDMLYEVGNDALDSLNTAKTDFGIQRYAAIPVRHRIQSLGHRKLQSAAIRRALNDAHRSRGTRPRCTQWAWVAYRQARSGQATGRSPPS